jgi:hypothetical protein
MCFLNHDRLMNSGLFGVKTIHRLLQCDRKVTQPTLELITLVTVTESNKTGFIERTVYNRTMLRNTCDSHILVVS